MWTWRHEDDSLDLEAAKALIAAAVLEPAISTDPREAKFWLPMLASELLGELQARGNK